MANSPLDSTNQPPAPSGPLTLDKPSPGKTTLDSPADFDSVSPQLYQWLRTLEEPPLTTQDTTTQDTTNPRSRGQGTQTQSTLGQDATGKKGSVPWGGIMQGLFLLVVGTGATLGGTMVAHFYPASGAASGSIDALPLLEQVLRKSDQGWSLLQYHAQAVPKTVGKTLGQRLGLLGSAPQGQSTGFAPLDLSDRERQQLQMELEQLQGQWQALQDQIAQLEQQLAKGDGNPGDGSPDGNQVVSELSLENRIDNLSHRLSPPISHLKQGETLRVTLPTDVLFGDGEVALQPDAALLLNNVVTDLKAHPPSHLSIATHTDNVGDADYNQALSFRRSQAVMTYLQAQSSHDHQWNILGYGESLPLVDNSTNTNRQRNRRLEITFEL